jgi:anaerobic magnesium-protoporphyrin IX monomethyl ester cyclase
VMIRDYPATGGDWTDFVGDLREFAPDAILFTTTTATVNDDLEAARIAKEHNRGIMTIAKGEFLNVFGEKTIEAEHALDIILLGEAEETLAELTEEKPLEKIAGILFARSGELGIPVRTAQRALIEDLDSLAFPARDLLNNELYRSPETGNKLTVIHANRGCPAECIFCPAGALSNYTLRLRSPENIIGEIVECVERFGIGEFLFHGDTFTMKKSWVIDLCKRIVERGLHIRWGCNSRVDTIDDERAEWMKRAGCWVVAFGIESGSQELLDRMKKKQKIEEAFAAVEVCRRAGLRTHAFYVIGLPWETKETLAATFDLAERLDTDFFDINIAYPLPGTEFYELAVREGLIEPSVIGRASYARAGVRTYRLSAQELTAWRKRALVRLYLRPRYIVRTLSRIRSRNELRHYLASAIRRVKHLLGISL